MRSLISAPNTAFTQCVNIDRVQAEWDGRRRLHKLLPYYLDAESTPLNQAMGKAWMIAAVRRIRKPGCKVDAVLTLQSPQGTGKSTFFRVLASDDWFNVSLEIGSSAKEVIENASGSWIIELQELSILGKREAEEVKKFVSIQSDRARTAYARVAKEVPRQFVLGASVNRPDFLIDESGNRRFWDAEVGITREKELRRDRDQLWAEAAHLEAKREPHNIPEELWPVAEEVAERHTVEDAVAEEVVTELAKISSDDAVITAADLYAAIGATDVTKRRGPTGRSVASGARRAGWRDTRIRFPGSTQR
jgi:predicted P-loop ATPase